MSISREQVVHVARLARLELGDEEIDRLGGQLSQILDAVSKVSELDLSDVPPLLHPLDMVNVLGDDEPLPSLPLTDALRNAPDAKPGTIVGIRPEHLDISPTGWSLRVEAVEMLGAERLVYGRWAHGSGDETVILRTEESHAVPTLGTTIHVTPRPDRLHLFDASSGKRL